MMWHQYCNVTLDVAKQSYGAKFQKLSLKDLMAKQGFSGEGGAGHNGIVQNVIQAAKARYTFVDVTFKLISVATEHSGDSIDPGKTNLSTVNWPIYCIFDQWKRYRAINDWNWLDGTPAGMRKLYVGQSTTFRLRKPKGHPPMWTTEFNTSTTWMKELDTMLARCGIGIPSSGSDNVGSVWTVQTGITEFGMIFYAFPPSVYGVLENPKIPTQWNIIWEVSLRVGVQWSTRRFNALPGLLPSAPSLDSCYEMVE